MSKIVARGCLGSSFVLSRAWRSLAISPDSVSRFVLGKKDEDLVISARVPLLSDALHSICFSYRCTSQFEDRPRSMVTGRIFARHCERTGSSGNGPHGILFCVFWPIVCIGLDEATRNLHGSSW